MNDRVTRLRDWRQQKGLTLEEVSGLTGVSKPMLSMAERGQRTLSADLRVVMARRLNVPVRVLFDVEPVSEGVA